MNTAQKIIEHTEKLLSDILDYDVKIEVKPVSGYEKAQAIVEVRKISSQLKTTAIALKLIISEIEIYYYTILFIKNNKPYISNGSIAKSLYKDTSTICKAVTKANDLMSVDESFESNYKKLETELLK
jgi:hypothetical protein